jgi:hypothetical protein
MVSQKEKSAIRGIGAVLIVIGLYAYFYPWGLVFEPYREYALPLGVLGIMLLVVSYALPYSTRES